MAYQYSLPGIPSGRKVAVCFSTLPYSILNHAKYKIKDPINGPGLYIL